MKINTFLIQSTIAILFLNGCSLGTPQDPTDPQPSKVSDTINNPIPEKTTQAEIITEPTLPTPQKTFNNSLESQSAMIDLDPDRNINWPPATTFHEFIEIIKSDNVAIIEKFILVGETLSLDKLDTETKTVALHYATSYSMAQTLSDRSILVAQEKIPRTKKLKHIYEPAIEITDINGNSPLHQMAKDNHTGAIEFIITKKCNWRDAKLMNLQNPNDRTPLHLAIISDNLAASFLLSKCSHIDINLQDNLGRSPLHYAVLNNNTANVLSLLSQTHHKVTLTKDLNGESPIDIAKRMSFKDQLFILESFFEGSR